MRRAGLPFLFLSVFAGLCLASVLIGANRLSLAALLSAEAGGLLTLTASRLPRLAALVLTGAGLAVSGVILQQVVRNRFVEPGTTGGLESAKLGILVAITLLPGQGQAARMAMAFVFCFAASLIYIALIDRLRMKSVVLIPVVGLMYGSVLGALAEFYAYRNNILQSMQTWLLGDFSKIVAGNYEVVWLILPVVALSYLWAHRLTVLGMGAATATGLGLGYRATMVISLLMVSVTVSVTVISVGAIPFVGLVVPNLIAAWRGDNLARTLPLVALSGAMLLLACDIIGRLLIWPFEVPIGLTVGGIGGIGFLLLLLRGNVR